MPKAKLKPWDKQPNESFVAYDAFKTYLEMSERSMQKVARKLNKSPALIHRWAVNHDWKNRAGIWDASILEDARKSAARDYKQMIELQINLGRMLLAKGATAIKNMNFDNVPLKALSAILQLIDRGVAIERSARDINNEINKNTIVDNALTDDVNLDFSKLTDGELDVFGKLLDKLRGNDTAESRSDVQSRKNNASPK